MADSKSKEMVKAAIEAMKDKKAEDIRVIDISNVSVIADYFIIANGNNPNQVQAIQIMLKNSYIKQDLQILKLRDITVQAGFFLIMKM